MTERRQETTEHWQHITARCVDRRLVIVDFDMCADAYLDQLGEVVLRRRWVVATYAVMGNHVHLLVWTPQADLGRGMKAVQEGFAVYANHRDGLLGRGHFWSGRFRNEHVADEHHAAAAIRYIGCNAVKHGLRASPEEWPHSAHHALLGLKPCPEWLDREVALELVGGLEAYRALVGKDDRLLVAELLATFGAAEGTRRAIDMHWLEPSLVMDVLGCSQATFYRRLRDGRVAYKLATSSGVPLLLAAG